MLLYYFLVASVKIVYGADWSYENVDSWGEDFKDCNGKMQSPIDLSNIEKMTEFSTPLLELNNYKNFCAGSVKITNNGHTTNIEPKKDSEEPKAQIKLHGNEHIVAYQPKSLHFHWGAPGKPGSEHIINNTRFDMELHIVHQKHNLVKNKKTQQDKFEFAVLGFMLKIVDEPKRKITALSKIFSKLTELKKYKSEVSIEDGLDLEEMLMMVNFQKYYSYQGSLTTPPCLEAVTWIVFMNVLEVSKSEVSKFFELEDSHGKPLISNFRPIQPLGNRSIFYNTKQSNNI